MSILGTLKTVQGGFYGFFRTQRHPRSFLSSQSVVPTGFPNTHNVLLKYIPIFITNGNTFVLFICWYMELLLKFLYTVLIFQCVSVRKFACIVSTILSSILTDFWVLLSAPFWFWLWFPPVLARPQYVSMSIRSFDVCNYLNTISLYDQ